MSKGGLARLALAIVALTVTGCTLNRPADPVVLTGAQLPALSSVAAGDVVAFRWANGWDQVPVQVDERKSIDFGAIYNSTPMGFATTVYADPGTFTGADANANVDADDEVVLMGKDVGLEAPGGTSAPAGVVGGSWALATSVDPRWRRSSTVRSMIDLALAVNAVAWFEYDAFMIVSACVS